MSKADLMASYLPDQENMDRMSSMFFCGDCSSESPYVLPEGTGIFAAPQPYDPLISKDDLMASYPVPQFADFYFDDGIWKQPEESSYSCCDDDTFRGHMTYTIKDTDVRSFSDPDEVGGCNGSYIPPRAYRSTTDVLPDYAISVTPILTPTPAPTQNPLISGRSSGSAWIDIFSFPDRAYVSDFINGSVRCGEGCSPDYAIPDYAISVTPTPTPVPTKPTPTPSPLTLDVYHIGVWIYPHIPASYYEWSKFPPEPTPRVISDEEWEEVMA